MRAIDLRHMGREHVICCWELDGVLIDPGPQSCEDTLLAALDGEQPRALLLTHIHFDHAGTTGSLVRRWPDIPVYVHERGARHLADPMRLVASVSRLYGEDRMRELWGDVKPVPKANLRVLEGGETGVEGGYRVEYTPGHASHHVCYLHVDSGVAFVGDVAGMRIPPSDFTMAPTPPPDIDVAAWERSLDTVRGWGPQTLAMTHFGPVEQVEAQLDAVRERLYEQVRLAGERDLEGFVEAWSARVRAEAGEAAPAYLQTAPPDHLFAGLERWRSQQAEVS
ncbi:MAG TPA: MBL fold metallo-hydrolase [Solirubrobacteraceae bacterium]|nr:MBL fold metallo-hydrolase [Solirubrobacteraceae bacterium]